MGMANFFHFGWKGPLMWCLSPDAESSVGKFLSCQNWFTFFHLMDDLIDFIFF